MTSTRCKMPRHARQASRDEIVQARALSLLSLRGGQRSRYNLYAWRERAWKSRLPTSYVLRIIKTPSAPRHGPILVHCFETARERSAHTHFARSHHRLPTVTKMRIICTICTDPVTEYLAAAPCKPLCYHSCLRYKLTI